MRAVVCHEAELAVAELSDPTPSKGQVVLNVLRCGICGSDLHARHHCNDLAEIMVESGYDDFMRSDHQVVFGHEFVGEIGDFGPGCRRRVPTGSPVVALPLLRRGANVHPTGLSAQAPGAYAERVVVQESLMLPVPNGLPPDVAALTEPMAIGLHAVRRGEVGKRTVAVVVGCGPIGLAVICVLKMQGVRAVIASDLSAHRRALATACGADVVVDPQEQSPYTTIDQRGLLRSAPEGLELLVGTMERLQRVPLPWPTVLRVADKLGLGPKGPVIFECVGVPGMIDEIITSVPFMSRVVVVGVCMGADRIRPAMAINKEVDLRFVLGYSPVEFRDTLHLLAEGALNAAPLVTGTVGLGGVGAAFDALGDAGAHAKILIDPMSEVTTA